MKILAKLYGTLGRFFPGYVHADGVIVEIPDNGKVKDVLSFLNIPESENVMVAVDGHIMKQDDNLTDNAKVYIMQPLHGG